MANRFQLWGQAGWASAEVVGETHYAKAIRALFGNDFDPRGTDITVPVQLIPDRNNRHDRNAVGVWSGNSLLGHLPRPEAARYVQVLTTLTSRDLIPEVSARITGREWGAADGRPAAFDGSIRLDLAEPHMLVPANAPPFQDHRLLPSGSAVQVVGQQQYLEALIPLLRPEGECWAYVTLHEMADHMVEVRLGDARVGDLSPKMSGELLPTLRHLAEQGLVTAARAIVRGDSGKSELMLYVARAQDLPEIWQGAAKRPAAGPAAGRGAASVPSSGVAATGPVTPGSHPVPGAVPAAPASAVPGLSGSGGMMSGGPAGSGGLVPNWVTAGESLPSWASPPSTMPAVAPPPATPLPPRSPVTPVSPPPVTPVSPPPGQGMGWAAGSGATTSMSASRFEPPATTVVPQREGPGPLVADPPAAAAPVSPAPGDRSGFSIAETTVIPALAAVVKARSGATAGNSPVSPAPSGAGPHAPIPPAPTGVKFVVPAGWPTPPAGWYPPAGWRPDPAWPQAPAGWQWWVPTWD
ncbi:hypothetical protein QLQ12_20620 [Actinoplanes sp. NEAU-A12]|uniref:Uncharacterized protein n=1 Tax=Actinoplanes sandaracinus TaxID=3045177 RepID=A0ABT6WMR0_9ACTN|nr:hypothetical protein [Actinoplanes sandaracinus]MDI6101021.1 hypothetical protein [Actinoplanes sandaracinus]